MASRHSVGIFLKWKESGHGGLVIDVILWGSTPTQRLFAPYAQQFLVLLLAFFLYR